MKIPFINTDRRVVFFSLAVLLSLIAFDCLVIGTTDIRAATLVLIYVTALGLHTFVTVKNKNWKDLRFAAVVLAVQIPAFLLGTNCWAAFIGIEMVLLGLLFVGMNMIPARKTAETETKKQ